MSTSETTQRPRRERPAPLKETERVGPGPAARAAARWAAAWWSARRPATSARPPGGSSRRMAPDRVQDARPSSRSPSSASLATAVGPRVLGRATDLVFAGLIGGRLPDGLTKAAGGRAAPRARRRPGRRHGRAAWTSCPARASTSTPWARCCSLVLAIYVGAAALGWLAGLPPQRRRAGHRAADALRRRGQGPPAAAGLLRPAAAR